MTASQLSVMLSGLRDNNIIIRYGPCLLDIKKIEIGIGEDEGNIFIIADKE